MTLRITPPRVLLAALAAVALAACAAPGTTEPEMDVAERARFSASADTTTVQILDDVNGFGSGHLTEDTTTGSEGSAGTEAGRSGYGLGSGG